MSKINIGFIGTGNMGGAIVRAVCKTVDPQKVYISNRSHNKAEDLAEMCSCRVCYDNLTAAKGADYIFLGVKPWQIIDVIREIDGVLTGGEVIVSMAAGVPGYAMAEALPILGKKLRGYDHPDAVLTAVESRSSSPVRIVRDADGQTSLRGLYPAGEGAGYAGGIMSAAVDGMEAAEAVLKAMM